MKYTDFSCPQDQRCARPYCTYILFSTGKITYPRENPAAAIQNSMFNKTGMRGWLVIMTLSNEVHNFYGMTTSEVWYTAKYKGVFWAVLYKGQPGNPFQ